MINNKRKRETLNVFEIEAERIVSLFKERINVNTILDIFASELGFVHYQRLECQSASTDFNHYTVLNLWQLEDYEKKIIAKLRELNEGYIQKINFIQEEIERRKSNILKYGRYNLFELFSVMHLNLNSARLINEDWSLNEDTIKSFLYWYSSEMGEGKYLSKYERHRYDPDGAGIKTSENGESYFKNYKDYLKNKEYERSFYSYGVIYTNIFQRGFYYATLISKDVHEESAEGFLFKLIFKFKNKEITMEDLYSQIEEKIQYEKTFYSKRNNDHLNNDNKEGTIEILPLKPPVLIETEYPCFDINLRARYESKKMIIGYEEKKQNKFLRKNLITRKNLTINRNANILTISSEDDNSEHGELLMLLQDIFSGKGVFYLDNSDNSFFIDEINNVALTNHRIKDVVYLSLEQAEELLNQKSIFQFIDNRKIVVIKFPDIEKSREDIFNRIIEIHNLLFNEILNYHKLRNINMDNTIYINKTGYLTAESLTLLKEVLDSFESDSLCCRLSCFDLTWRDKIKGCLAGLLKENIDYCKIMRCYDPTETIEYFNFDGEESTFRVNSRDIKSLGQGEFLLAYKMNIKPIIFKSFYYQKNIASYKYVNSVIYKQ